MATIPAASTGLPRALFSASLRAVRRHYIPLALLAILALAGIGAWFLAHQPISVAVAVPTKGPAVEAIYATGTVEPVTWVKVGPTIPGRIESLACVEGTSVKQGQLLIGLEHATLEARVKEQVALLRFRQQEVDRFGALLKRDVASRQAYERALSELDQSTAALAAAQQLFEDTMIRAPMDGVVLRKEGEIGAVVKAGDAICWIGQATPLRVTADIDEEDAPRLKLGQQTLISADAFPDRVIEGQVNEVTPMGDPINKSYRARISLPDDSPLLFGMTTEVNVIVRHAEEAVLVPPDALKAGAIWAVVDGLAHRIPVKTGVYGDNSVEIREGLKGDEILILNPPADLAEGDAVRLRNR
jgi:RND family efflux transporter MFP subunit